MTGIDIRGKRFAITGTLSIVRSAAVAKLEGEGGIYKKRVTRDTDYLIIGDLRRISHKLERAQQLQKEGRSLLILDGDALFSGEAY